MFILPSVQAVWGLHALSLPSAGCEPLVFFGRRVVQNSENEGGGKVFCLEMAYACQGHLILVEIGIAARVPFI